MKEWEDPVYERQMEEMKDNLIDFEHKIQQGSIDGNEDMGEQVFSLFSIEEKDIALVKPKGEWVAFTSESSHASTENENSANNEPRSTVRDTQADKDPHNVSSHVIKSAKNDYEPLLVLDQDESRRKVLKYTTFSSLCVLVDSEEIEC